jgi:hypothetical protein
MPRSVYEVDARYRKFVEANLAITLADVARDMKRRSDGLAPTIESCFIAPTAEGRIVVVLGEASDKPEPF